MITGILGLLFGFAAGVCLLVGLLPLLGWLNWITSLPLGIIGLIFSVISARGKVGRNLGVAGSYLCGAIIVVALLRLFLGGGIL